VDSCKLVLDGGVYDHTEKLTYSLKEAVKRASTLQIQRSYVNNTGDPKKAEKLSTDRAKAVMVALVKAGVDGKRLETAGFGAKKPLADNATEEGRAKNRRLELVKAN
jgi:OOP family OmpA-OmpF porin